MSLSLKTKVCSKVTNVYLKTKYEGLYEKDLLMRKKYSNNKGMQVIVRLTSFSKRLANLQGILVSAPEEIAYRYGMISREQLMESISKYGKSTYGKHLLSVAEGKLRK